MEDYEEENNSVFCDNNIPLRITSPPPDSSSQQSVVTHASDYMTSVNNIFGHKDAVLTLSAFLDGNRFASGGYDSILRIWSLDDDSLLQSIQLPFEIHSILSLNDYRLLVGLGGSHGIVKVDLKQPEEGSSNILETFNGHSDAVSSLAMLHDGTTVVSGSYDKTIRLWSRINGRLIDTLTGHNEAVTCLAVLPLNDNMPFHDLLEVVVTGSTDCTIMVWNTADRTVMHTLLHGSYVWSVKCPTFDQVVSGGQDGCVKLWDVLHGTCLRILPCTDGQNIRCLELLRKDSIIIGSNQSLSIVSLNEEEAEGGKTIGKAGCSVLAVLRNGAFAAAQANVLQVWR